MNRPILCALVLLFAGCRSSTPTRPTPEPAQPVTTTVGPAPTTTVGGIPVIAVGQDFAARFADVPLVYQLTAPIDGTLTAEMRWNFHQTGGRLRLRIGDVSVFAGAPDWSSVTARLPVKGDVVYSVLVDEGYSPWDYGFDVPFVLKTSVVPTIAPPG